MVRNAVEGLVGRFFKCPSLSIMGEVIAKVNEDMYLVQPVNTDGSVPVGQELLSLTRAIVSAKDGLGFRFYDSVDELTHSAPKPVPTMTATVVSVEPKGRLEGCSQEILALDSLCGFIGKHGVVSVDTLITSGQPTSFEVVVEGDLTAAKANVPSKLCGLSVVLTNQQPEAVEEPKKSSRRGKKFVEPMDLVPEKPEVKDEPEVEVKSLSSANDHPVLLDVERALDELSEMVGSNGVVSVRESTMGAVYSAIVEVNGSMTAAKAFVPVDKEDGIHKLYGMPVEFIAYQAPETPLIVEAPKEAPVVVAAPVVVPRVEVPLMPKAPPQAAFEDEYPF